MPVFRNIVNEERYVGPVTLNFVWRHDTRPIYIMDNHRAALWCWLRELAADEPYSLVHVDAHWDLADPRLNEEQLVALEEARSLEEFDTIREEHPFCGDCPAIRWDTFIAPLLYLRPKLQRGLFLVTQDFYDTAVWDRRFRKFTESNLLRHLGKQRSGRRVLDVDLDYFFDRRRQKAGVERTVSLFIKKLLEPLRSDDVITIALSPDCCGGLGNSMAMCRAFCGALGIQVPDELAG